MSLSKLFLLGVLLVSAVHCYVDMEYEPTMNSKIKNIVFNDPKVPSPIGPYVVAKRIDPTAAYLYISGQIGLNPLTSTLPPTVEQQTVQALTNIMNILQDSNSSLDNILKITVYLTDMNNFDAVNTQYATFFPNGNYPTRVCIAVSALPKGALIEMDVTAIDNS